MKSIPDNLYREIQKNIPIACVDVVIKVNDKTVLGERRINPAKGKLWFIGGRILKGESIEAAVKRKVKEELGVNCKIIKYLGSASIYFRKGRYGFPVHTINFLFLVELKSKKIKPDFQHSKIVFMNKKEFENAKLDPYVKQFIWLSGIFGKKKIEQKTFFKTNF
jgi:ADP-ribose pyrophosphatase YjhB (NUDIX family)